MLCVFLCAFAALRETVLQLLNKAIFGGLIALLVIAAIPYGTVEPWWRAAFVCAVFAIFIVALVSGSFRIQGGAILLPVLALAVLAFVQTLSPGSLEVAGLSVWNTISADPYQTRFFALQCLALTACLALLYRYADTEGRRRVLIWAVIAVAVASAIFGIVHRPTPRGYAQFINKNHFAYLMEMAFGLVLGLMLARGIRRDRLMIYVAL